MREEKRGKVQAYDSSGRGDGKDSPVLPFDSALWSMTNELETVLSTTDLGPTT